MAANCQDVADVLSWTSASGIARSLYINKSWNEGCRGALSRAFLVLLLAVPLVLGLAELTLGIMFRHQPDGCPYPLPVWLIIDGVAALLTAILSLLDIARVHALSTDDEDDSENARKARTKALGPYACTGVAVIFLIPLFRLVWLLYGLDILHRIDPSSLSHFFSTSLHPGACNPTLHAFISYYIEAVTLLVLFVLGVVLLFVLVIAVVQLSNMDFSCCCRWRHRCCGGGAGGKDSAPLMTSKTA